MITSISAIIKAFIAIFSSIAQTDIFQSLIDFFSKS